jgi:hypothetical protein
MDACTIKCTIKPQSVSRYIYSKRKEVECMGKFEIFHEYLILMTTMPWNGHQESVNE